MPAENLNREHAKIHDAMNKLAEQGHTEIYCLELVDYKNTCKKFAPPEEGATVKVTGFFIRETLKQAKCVAEDAFSRGQGVICICRTPKKRGKSFIFPGKVIDLSQ